MTDYEPLDELAPALQEALQALGGERAPAELRDRVELARTEPLVAPAELWDRVAAAVAEEAAARMAPEPQLSGRLLKFPSRRWVAAAAVLVAGVSTVLFVPFGPSSKGPQMAGLVSEEVRAMYRERVVAAAGGEVPETEISVTGRSFVALLGGEMES